MEKERGMEERFAIPALQEFPQLSLLHFLSPQNQDLIKNYLVYTRASRYGPAMQEGTIRALKNFIVLMPAARQATLSHDLTQTTATDVDAWLEAAFRHPLAPSTVATRLRILQGFFACLHDQGAITQPPCGSRAITSWCPRTSPAPWRTTRSWHSFGSSMPCGIARCFYLCCGAA